MLLFAALAEELKQRGASVDQVALQLATTEISAAALIAAAHDALGRDSSVLTRELKKGVKNPLGSGAVQDPGS